MPPASLQQLEQSDPRSGNRRLLNALPAGELTSDPLAGSRQRIILHSDMDYFYAAVECLRRPELRDRPMVVGGDQELRHGVVLAKNPLAKSLGINTAMTLVEAKSRCPELIVVPPDHRLYTHYSRRALEIYYQFTDLVEPFGPDEAWLDVSGCTRRLGQDGYRIAQQLSQRIRQELGLTVSVGVSWNKVFAKFGSDYQKPNAITHLTPQNYQELVWSAPVEKLLYVGRASKSKLNELAIYNIGDLARADTRLLKACLGKMGLTLRSFARGEDITAVQPLDPERGLSDRDIKSVSNGLTAPRDICSEREARMLIYMLAQSVSQRLREQGLRARTVCIQVRDQAELASYSRQTTLASPSNITSEIAAAAMQLLKKNEPLDGSRPLRSLTLQATNLISASSPQQLDIFGDEGRRMEMERLDASVDALRRRFGKHSVRRAVELGDELMGRLEIKTDAASWPPDLPQTELPSLESPGLN